jgi:hypothetical protein
MHGAVGAVMRSFVQIVQIAALAGILAIAACSDANMHGQTQAEGVAADVKKSPAIITVKGGPVAVPVPQGDTESSRLKPLPVDTPSGIPQAIFPGFSLNIGPTPPVPDSSARPTPAQ